MLSRGTKYIAIVVCNLDISKMSPKMLGDNVSRITPVICLKPMIILRKPEYNTQRCVSYPDMYALVNSGGFVS